MSFSLRPYRTSDAGVITTWIDSEYAMRQWCADRYGRYPVMPEDMDDYHRRFIDGTDSFALTMVENDEVVGYCTLRRPDGGVLHELRIGFVIVSSTERGKGLGRTLVRMAVRHALETLGASKVSLGVFENNMPAIRCYEASGFRRVERFPAESYRCLGETWNCIEMELTKGM